MNSDIAGYVGIALTLLAAWLIPIMASVPAVKLIMEIGGGLGLCYLALRIIGSPR